MIMHARSHTQTHTPYMYQNISPALIALLLFFFVYLVHTHTHADQVSLDAVSANDKVSLAKCHNTPMGAAPQAVRSSIMSDLVAIALLCTFVGSHWTSVDVISY